MAGELFSLQWVEAQVVLLKLGLAFLLALPVGWDRERNTVLMGIRTFPIVAMASCGFMLTVLGISEGDPQAQARVLQGLVAGMGFIGGGAILKNDGQVKGTATAASLWATGAIGAAVAFNRLEVAVVMSLVIFVVLRFLTPLKEKVLDDRDGEEGSRA